MAEKLLKNQIDLFERLEKAQSNYKKSPKSRITKGYVETRINILEKLHTEFNSNHKELIQIIKPEQAEVLPYFTKDAHDEFEEMYIAYMSDLKELQDKFTEKHKYESNTMPCNEVKLPRIQLPTFSGNYEEWQTFYDMFVSLIHNNE
ncbi:PREDICTED: uncharacterized protein LOC106110289, partial [Papilio polytes]|uniref:uncharacterized protein LOC106110289 n=1 Tax=Papilio polytes TaxID=76194 RepID=UPI00067609FD